MLVIEGVSVKYSRQEQYALRALSFSCESSGITAFIGRSGVGKSTLLALIAGIYQASDPAIAACEGRILVNGRCAHDCCGPANISWVPQEPVLLDHLSVLENVLLPISLGGITDPDRANACDILCELEIEKYSNVRPRALSGGQRTRVSLARALVSEPKCLCLDEPFVALDLMTRLTIYMALRKRRRRDGLTTILTSHNVPEAVILSDRIVIIRDLGNRTEAEVVENRISLPSNDPIACLRLARDLGAPIESKVARHAGLSA